MTQINGYLTFNGNCRTAMQFYKDCLGGELTLQTIGESPLADKMPPTMKASVLHALLKKDGLILMGSDMVGERGLIKGNGISLVINCSSEEEIRNYYAKLSAQGTADHPLAISFWGALFGDLTDKYGNQWMLTFENYQHN